MSSSSEDEVSVKHDTSGGCSKSSSSTCFEHCPALLTGSPLSRTLSSALGCPTKNVNPRKATLPNFMFPALPRVRHSTAHHIPRVVRQATKMARCSSGSTT